MKYEERQAPVCFLCKVSSCLNFASSLRRPLCSVAIELQRPGVDPPTPSGCGATGEEVGLHSSLDAPNQFPNYILFRLSNGFRRHVNKTPIYYQIRPQSASANFEQNFGAGVLKREPVAKSVLDKIDRIDKIEAIAKPGRDA